MSWLDSILVPVNREGYPFIAFGAVIAFVLFFVYDPLGWAGVLVTLGLVFYFRDPDRITPVRAGGEPGGGAGGTWARLRPAALHHYFA